MPDTTPAPPRPPHTEPLPDLQQQILDLLARGHTHTEIGRRVHLSRQGVEYHVKRMLRRFHARNGAHLVARAYQTGHLPIPTPKGPAR